MPLFSKSKKGALVKGPKRRAGSLSRYDTLLRGLYLN